MKPTSRSSPRTFQATCPCSSHPTRFSTPTTCCTRNPYGSSRFTARDRCRDAPPPHRQPPSDGNRIRGRPRLAPCRTQAGPLVLGVALRLLDGEFALQDPLNSTRSWRRKSGAYAWPKACSNRNGWDRPMRASSTSITADTSPAASTPAARCSRTISKVSPGCSPFRFVSIMTRSSSR